MLRRALSARHPWRHAGWLCRGLLLGALTVTAACDHRQALLAPVVAQPKTPAARNLTSFYPALQCMDALFLAAKRPRVMISAAQILDRTKQVSVGSRSMLITAINHMTRRSKAFVFVEQGLASRSSGDTLVLERDNPSGPKPTAPRLYIGGAISQIDNDTRNTTVNAELSGFDPDDTAFDRLSTARSNAQSVVTLDLHLVNYPSRVVIPGSSVSNSIVVTRKSLRPGLAGTISQRTLGLSLQIDRLESTGQAVRSLIELGLIEMLGQYAGVPFWDCLSLPTVNARKTAREERAHVTAESPAKLRQAQSTLQALGYLRMPAPTGRMDAATRKALARFQAAQGILANGTLDFDTMRALTKAEAALRPPPPKTPPARTPARTSARPAASPPRPTYQAQDPDGYQSLNLFVQGAL